MGSKNVRVHIFVEGRVQGVFFRAWTRRLAQSLKLTGWVRNLEDGRVEVVAEGERKQVDQLIKFLAKPDQLLVKIKKGPPLAKIEHVNVSWEKASGEGNGFEIKY